MTSTKRFSFTLLATFAFGAPLLACGGQVSLGDDKSQSQAVDPTQVGVATMACPKGFQHANICCTGGSAQAPAQCEAWSDDPFHPCETGWTLYPNQAECCSLADPSQCVSCDGHGNCAGAGEPGPDQACRNDRCPPGWNGISPEDPHGCCRYTASGEECFGSDSTGPDDGGPTTVVDASANDYDGGPAPDAGVDDGGFGGPDDGGVVVDDGGVIDVDGGGPPPPMCDGQCPPDWAPVAGQPGVCCHPNPGGGEECFAFPVTGGADQPPYGGSGGSTGPGTPVEVDAGAPRH